MSVRKPRSLVAGDRVAVVAPASPFAREEFDRGVAELRRLGYEPVYDDTVFAREDEYLAGSARLRAAAFMRYWDDPLVRALVAVRGGFGSVELLPLLDAAHLAARPRLLVGYSDITSMLSWLTCQCGIAALHGPMLDGRLANGSAGYDEQSFVCLLNGRGVGLVLAPDGLERLRAGEAVGPLFGGTIAQIVASLGTPYAFDPPDGCILFLEDVNERPYRIDRMLTQLRLSGILRRARALVFGEMRGCDEQNTRITARDVIHRLTLQFDGPVLFGFPSGHTTGPCWTLPLGVAVRVVSDPRPPSSSRIPQLSDRKTIHLIGLCGTAMATLAALLKTRGHEVRGSDQNVYPPMSDFLIAQGIHAMSGYDAAHVTSDIDLVVVGNAISRGNPQLESVLERKIRYCSLPEAIRDHFLWGARSIVLAGTHGKTTTTSLTGWMLAHGGLDPTVLVGGIALNFGAQGSSYRVGSGRDFVIEGDEYDSAYFDKTAKFLKYLPDIAVINNVEFDHADIYADLEAVLLAFRRLANLIPRSGLLLLGADSPHAAGLRAAAVSPVETFGLSDGADWQAYDVSHHDGQTHFGVRRSGEPFGRFASPLLGLHNVRNALAAIAVASHAGIGPLDLAEGLRQFRGIKRRLETIGVAHGVTILDDFAHHPTAVHETLGGLRTGYRSRRIWAVFEPRSASSCRRVFQDDFARAFAAADEVIVSAVFRSTLPQAERLSAEQLVDDLHARGQRARYIADVDEIVRTLVSEHRDGDVVVLMSNGAFGGIHGKLLQALSA